MTTTAAPAGTVPAPPTPGATGTAGDAYSGIWPIASDADVQAVGGGGDGRFLDPQATAREFAVMYIGMDDPVVFGFAPTGPGRGEVGVGFRFGEGRRPLANPRATFTVGVQQLGAGKTGSPWTVVGATSPTLQVDAPGPQGIVTSPLRLAGAVTAFESNAAVQVREDGMLAGELLGSGHMTGAAGSVSFRPATKPAGAVVVLEVSSADGQGILSATVVRVRFGEAAAGVGSPAVRCNERRSGGVGAFGALADVRVGAHDGYDRIAFEFAGSLPFYEVKPARLPLRTDPSDQPLALDGERFLDVVFRGASAVYTFDASGDQVLLSSHAPGRVSPHFAAVYEAAERGDFEGVLIWTLGIRNSTCLRVLELQSPPRLVLDVVHNGE